MADEVFLVGEFSTPRCARQYTYAKNLNAVCDEPGCGEKVGDHRVPPMTLRGLTALLDMNEKNLLVTIKAKIISGAPEALVMRKTLASELP